MEALPLPRPIRLFAVATLTPLPLLMIAAGFGGLWAWLALGYMTVFTIVLDEFTTYSAPEAEPGSEFPAADELSIILGASHFILLLVAVFAVSGQTGLGWVPRVLTFLAFGMFFGQVSNSNAHELIHRADRRLFLLGQWIYISLLFGHHTSAHRLIHHRFVATEDDPNTAAQGESFWEFLPRAWRGSFAAGYEMERQMRRQSGAQGINPYVTYVAGGLGFALFFLVVMGPGGLLAYLLLAAYSQGQLLLSDYVQHYGLRRAEAGGGPEPVSDRHSWNAGQWFSAALMLNAPRHSAHHAHPAWPFPELTLPPAGAAPRLPYSLPVMGMIALFPGAWFRIMDKRLSRWRESAG